MKRSQPVLAIFLSFYVLLNGGMEIKFVKDCGKENDYVC